MAKSSKPGSWRPRSADFLEDGVRMACWSPLGVGRFGGTLIAILSISHGVVVYHPPGDPFSGDWVPLLDISDSLLEHFERTSQVTLDKIETMCISWSPLFEEISFISCGNKEGTITHWRFVPRPSSVTLSCVSTGFGGWITSLRWSKHSFDDVTRTSHAQLLVSTSDGSSFVLAMTFEPATGELKETGRILIPTKSSSPPGSVSFLDRFGTYDHVSPAIVTKGPCAQIVTVHGDILSEAHVALPANGGVADRPSAAILMTHEYF
ncbi:hypothetical protein M427DRAFT_253203 [Gonapodya prolifera JEL478]|uniref:Transcription factor IIIC 90kDa subunit N-terminal domain-containing protein n=1 Tax=Gonapodya prolifera (strain JEL478) TaxID=1344416 RepID=A0A139AL67_GONPJ|nr:hypothetical protein M427DRAFT_253203 [Gonapodya prolifera JEL478]|eukprot:KXS17529.1 hypothetical protein M427DRAFT_253203 [Gonapodya prolifera JEL478]